MKLVLQRNKQEGRWEVSMDDSPFYLISSEYDVDARTVVRRVQANNPGAQVGVKSAVFGPAVAALYGDVVWMQPNLPELAPTERD